jgi:hypothetical protein
MKNEPKNKKPEMGVLDYYLDSGIFAPYHSAESAAAVAEFNKCECCERKGVLRYHGFKSERSGTRVDISKCSVCGNEQEF